MAKQRELTQNLTLCQGEVVSDPTIVPMDGNQRCAFLKVRTFVDEPGLNGQWTTTVIDVPLIVLDQRKVDVTEQYVKKGKTILVRGYYKSWHDGQGHRHAMIVTKMDLGPMKFEGREEDVTSRPPTPD